MGQNEGVESAKRRAGEHAAELAADGMTVGLGTGSTAAYAVRALGRAVEAGLDVRGVPTSFQARALAREVGIPVCAPEDVARIDLAIDGADQVASGDLIKGGGAAHARERVIAAAAERFVVVVDGSKLADALSLPVPVEVLPPARSYVAAAVRDLGGAPSLRDAGGKDGPVVTDNGNLVLDVDFGRIDVPDALAADLSGLAGVIDHGVFVGLADEIHVGRESRVDVVTTG